jgi:hypothetical protein
VATCCAGTVGRPAAQRHVRSRAEQSDNGAQSSTATAAAEPISADPQAAASTGLTILEYKKPDSNAEFWTRFKLAFALKWRRFKKGSFLVMKLEGVQPVRTICFLHTTLPLRDGSYWPVDHIMLFPCGMTECCIRTSSAVCAQHNGIMAC